MGWRHHDGIGQHWRQDGSSDGRPVLFLNSLGTDLRMWETVIDDLPNGIRAIRMDTRGHGLSDAPDAPYSMTDLTDDAAVLLDHLSIHRATIVGISLGGMTAMSLALRQPKRVSALVLSNTAPKMGSRELWQDRIASVRTGGISSIADQILDRWFANPGEMESVGQWRNMLLNTSRAGYIGCCAALARADLTKDLGSLHQPTLVVAGSKDRASPPEVVRAGANLIPGAGYRELIGVGHLPPLEAPSRFTQLLSGFLAETSDI